MFKFISKFNSNKSSTKLTKSTNSTNVTKVIESTGLTDENLEKIQQVYDQSAITTINYYKNKNYYHNNNHIKKTESMSNFDEVNSSCSSNCINCKDSQINLKNKTNQLNSEEFFSPLDSPTNTIRTIESTSSTKLTEDKINLSNEFSESSEKIIERYFVENFLIMIILFGIGFLLQSYNQYINNIDIFSLILQFDLLFLFFFNTNIKQIDISCQLLETNLNILKISNFLFGIFVKGLFTRLNLHEVINVYLISIMIVFLERLFFNYYVIWFIHGKI